MLSLIHIYGKLDQVAAQLGAEFVRIHQRYLVRAGAVDRVTGSEVWVGEEILPILSLIHI